MAGSWATFNAPNTSTGTFGADIMILLTDGSVLIHNANNTPFDLENAKQWLRMSPNTQGDYSHPNWSAEIDMINARQYFGSGVLADGRVFAIGGEYSDDPAYPPGQNDSPLGETFDPTTNKWSQIVKPAAFQFVRGDASSSVLPDGRVLLGGASTTEPPSTWSNLTAVWDPNDNSWVQAGLEFGAVSSTTKNDAPEEEGFTLLQDGTVATVEVQNAPKSEKYLPSLDKWVTAGSTPDQLVFQYLLGALVYEVGPAVVLPSGTLFAIGATGQNALYTPASDPTQPGTWTAAPSFPNDTSGNGNWATLTAIDAPACVMPNGKVICVGGSAVADQGDYFSQGVTFLEYDPSSSANPIPNLDVQPPIPSTTYTFQLWFLVLPTGQLLVSAQGQTLYLYTPDPATSAPNPAWKPANISVPNPMVTGHSYTLSGTQLNGLTQAVAYGDDGNMATNYPIVKLVQSSTNQVVYLRSYNFSTMGIATGTTVPDDLVSCTIDIPANLATGAWNLYVIANGISSDAVAVQIAGQDCFFILENSTFSTGEIDTYVHGMPPTNAVFNPAFYVVVEGYTPAEMGIMSSAQLASPPIVPTVPSPFPGHMLIAFAGPVIPQDPTLPPTPQRFTFPYSITFVDDSVFGASATEATLNATFTASGKKVTNSAVITLTPNPNPFILHGDQTLTPPEPWYLSQDIRVFQVEPGTTIFGESPATTGTASQIAINYITAAVTNLRNNVGTTRADFDAMPQDEGSEVLQLQPTDPVTKLPVYNFAVARVRLRDTANAVNVRVFFRIWQAQQTNASYNSTTYARATNAEGQPIPVLGVQGDEILTIPFFAQARQLPSQQLHLQQDDFNRHDIDASSGETDYFFGCWLDINQPNDTYYPQRIAGVSADGPFDTVSPLFPIQRFMVAAHQCLIVEIAYDPDPIPAGADPSNNDKLAQRNLAFVGSPNPGNPESRRVPQTFEVKPTQPDLPDGVPPDELMIAWGSVPAGSFAEVYLPAVSADGIVATASSLYTTHLLQATDAHTLRFPAGGVTYIPIPPGVGVTFAGLLTLDLPAGIHKGDTYTAVVQQITSVAAQAVTVGTNVAGAVAQKPGTGQWRRTTGSFKLTIPVSTKALLLEPEEEYLSIMKWVAEAIPSTNRWYPVMQRYLSQIAGRVTFMGGNPGAIQPSGTGIVKLPAPQGHPQPHPQNELHFVGKIESLAFDRFGDFESFTLETMGGEMRRFESREPHIEELVRRAWQERSRVLVAAERHHPHRPVTIVLLV
ncbi:MAG TPA: kelch repeat-containing protein [Bryobacteraceae bacterium]|nr:kelch repeat-containing protein [Bryobacteraceae bacterium]